jgi:CRP-like cAMP-binding protein
LEQGPFYELIADRPEVAIGLIRVLSRRLRAIVRDVAQPSAKLAALPNEA